MLISEFEYELPDALIAQHPLDKRDASRMLLLDRKGSSWKDTAFAEFPSFLHEGDVVVVNNTRVFPARLLGERNPSGGRVEAFLVHEREGGVWEALVRPARRVGRGTRLRFGNGRLEAETIESLEGGLRLLRFSSREPFEKVLEELGQTPLPPYIKRPVGSLAATSEDDRDRYQTIYARSRGAVAAPTAGLHFTNRVLDEIRGRGASVVEITLHVGYATFEPVRVEEISEHKVAAERCEISDLAADAINGARARRNRIVAVGTTTARTLESAVDGERIISGPRSAGLTITPGYRFRVVDALLTNFHLPRSSLLLLVSAFADSEMVLAAYRHAVQAKYRFYSYGDCMLII
jgi:S-adenosylmethionine:tRNA ribosyltransferase-isomerase